MILLDCSKFSKLPLEIRPLYNDFMNIQIINKLKYQDLAFSQVLQYYTLDEIKEAFNTAYFDKEYLVTQPNTQQDKIIRLLEYGGQGVKASHFVTHTKNLFETTFSKEENDVQ